MVKLTKRKGFNFFRSYYDVYNELETDKDKVAFIDALLDRQFLGIKPTDLKGMAKFAYISQTNSIDSQVKGYEDKTGLCLSTPTVGGGQGVENKILTPTQQVQEKVQVKEKEKVKEETYRKFAHLSLSISDYKKLLINWDKVKIDNVLNSIENYAKNKNYKSLYLTANKWLQKEYPVDNPNNEEVVKWKDNVGNAGTTTRVEFEKMKVNNADGGYIYKEI